MTGRNVRTVSLPSAGPEPALEATMPARAAAPQPHSKFGRYVVHEKLGEGGMGVVYRAFDPRLDRDIALKLLHPGGRGSGSGGTDGRLLREAQAMARLSHPNVITVHDVGTMQDSVFVAMELAEGGTLRAWQRAPERDWSAVLATYLGAGEGLHAAHVAGLIHRDFKPDNVLVGLDGRPRVVDFGLARFVDKREVELKTDEELRSIDLHVSRTGASAGTPAYMAPEQHLGEDPTPAADQFAFCVALYEGLYGRRPFQADSLPTLMMSVLEDDPQPPPSDSAVPAWIWRRLRRGLHRDPMQRYPTMRALLDALSRDPRVRRRRVMAIGAAMTAVGAGAWVTARATQPEAEPVCAAAEEQIAAVWSEEHGDALREAFAASDVVFAVAAADAAAEALDRYTRDWAAMHGEACRATRVRGEQSEAMLDLRMECLGRRLDEFGALSELLADADAELTRTGVAATAKLVPVSVCADTDLLKAPVPVPDDPDVRERIRDLRASLARVKVHEDAGRYARGLALAKVAVQRARVVGHAPVLAEALLREGRLALATGDAARAEPLLREAVQTASAGRDDLTAAKAWIALVGVVGHGQAKAEPAEELIVAASAAVARAGAPAELQAELAIVTGATFLQQGRLEEAQDQFQLALERQRSASGPEHPTMGRIYNNLAAVNLLRQDAHAAKRNLERAIELQERTHGPQHPSVAPMKANFGALLLGQGRTSEAKEMLVESLQVWEASGARNQVYIGGANLTLSQAELYDGRFEQAESHARRALSNYESASTHHPDVARALTMVGASVHAQGRDAEALPLLERALELGEDTLGEDHDDFASLLTDLGAVQLELGHGDKALESLERALAIRTTRPGLPTELPRLRFALARACASTDAERALRLARNAKAGFEALPREHPMRRHLNDVDAWIAQHDAPHQ